MNVLVKMKLLLPFAQQVIDMIWVFLLIEVTTTIDDVYPIASGMRLRICDEPWFFGYPYQFSSTTICLGMTLQTWYEVELFSNTFWETTIGEVLHLVTWLVSNIQIKTKFLSHFLKDIIYLGIWFSSVNAASKLCLVAQSFNSML